MKFVSVLLPLMVCTAFAPAFADVAPASEPASADVPAPTLSLSNDVVALFTPQPPNPRRAYQLLTYNEDWRWLAQPHADHDLFDPIKYIPLAPDLSLSLGGSARFRFEDKFNPGFGATNRANPTPNDDYELYRTLFHADLRYGNFARAYVEGVAAFIDGYRRNPPPTPVPSDDADVHQAFVDISPFHQADSGFDLTLRAGRQELIFDKQKLVGNLDWGNARRSFDGVSLLGQVDGFTYDLFWTRPVIVDAKHFDSTDEETNFSGLHIDHSLFSKDHHVAAFVYYLNRARDTVTKLTNTEFNADGKKGDTDRVTIGSRFWGALGDFDYDAEGGVQVGRASGEDILAGYASLEAGYNFSNVMYKPRIALGYDYASGDHSPTDGKAGTFDQLFPTGHFWFGYLDLVGRQNIDAGKVTFTVNPTRDMKVWLDLHTFYLADSRDALYNAGGTAYRRSITGSAGSHVGDELDLTGSYQLGRHTTFLLGYCLFMPGEFIENTGKSQTPQMVYTSVEFKF